MYSCAKQLTECANHFQATMFSPIVRRTLGSLAHRNIVRAASARCDIQKHTYGLNEKQIHPIMKRFMSNSKMDTMESGTKTYMSLYPETSTDGGKV